MIGQIYGAKSRNDFLHIYRDTLVSLVPPYICHGHVFPVAIERLEGWKSFLCENPYNTTSRIPKGEFLIKISANSNVVLPRTSHRLIGAPAVPPLHQSNYNCARNLLKFCFNPIFFSIFFSLSAAWLSQLLISTDE